MHGVRRLLPEQQAASLDYSLRQVSISRAALKSEYETRMQETL
jgi:hypothetical protein